MFLVGYSMLTIWVFDQIEDKHTLYRGKDCMKKFYKSLREHAKSITDFEKKKMFPLTRKELKSNEDAKVCYICRLRFLKKLFRKEIVKKLDFIVITQVDIEAQQRVFVI